MKEFDEIFTFPLVFRQDTKAFINTAAPNNCSIHSFAYRGINMCVCECKKKSRKNGDIPNGNIKWDALGH